MKHTTPPALLLFTKRLAVATTLSLAALAVPFARAVDGYTVVFHVESGHTVEVDNGGHLVVDGTVVKLHDENGQSIGAASMNGAEGQIRVTDRTPGFERLARRFLNAGDGEVIDIHLADVVN